MEAPLLWENNKLYLNIEYTNEPFLSSPRPIRHNRAGKQGW